MDLADELTADDGNVMRYGTDDWCMPCDAAVRWLGKQTDPMKAWKTVPFRSWRGWYLRNTGYWVGVGWRDSTQFDRLTHEKQLNLLPRPPL